MSDGSKESDLSRYLFCPYCGTRLAEIADEHGDIRPTCPRRPCGFVDYGDPKPCVAVLIEHDGKLLLARRAVAPAKGKWDIPGGFIDGGESAEDAVRREIEEETGCVPKDIEYVGSIVDVYGSRDVPTLNLCFRASLRETELAARSDIAYVGSVVDSYGCRKAPTLNLCFRAGVRKPELRARSDVAELRWCAPAQLPAANEMAFAHQPPLLQRWRERAAAVAKDSH